MSIMWGVPKQSSQCCNERFKPGGQSLTEGGPLAKTQEKFGNDSEFLDVYTS